MNSLLKEISRAISISLMGTLMVSCSMAEMPNTSENKPLKKEVLEFGSIEEFQKAYSSNDIEVIKPIKSFLETSGDAYFPVHTLRGSNSDQETLISYEELIPDPQLAKLVNYKGEIIIADTLYKKRLTEHSTQQSQIEKNLKNISKILRRYQKQKKA